MGLPHRKARQAQRYPIYPVSFSPTAGRSLLNQDCPVRQEGSRRTIPGQITGTSEGRPPYLSYPAHYTPLSRLRNTQTFPSHFLPVSFVCTSSLIISRLWYRFLGQIHTVTQCAHTSSSYRCVSLLPSGVNHNRTLINSHNPAHFLLDGIPVVTVHKSFPACFFSFF